MKKQREELFTPEPRRPAIADVLYDLADAELIERWRQALPEFQQARMVLNACESELVRRMGERLALETEIGTVERSPQLGAYQWHPEALQQLFGTRLTERQWEEIFVPVTTIKTKTATVQKYARRLGISDADLEKCYFRPEGKQDLEFHPPLLEQLERSIEQINQKRAEEAADRILSGVE